jgi:hypothetical protein
MLPNVTISEQLALLATVDPVSQGVGPVSSGWVSAALFERFQAEVMTGLLGLAATVDAKLQQATDGAGTGVKDIAGKAIIQIVKATGDNKQAIINLRVNELDVANGFGYFRVTLTVGAAASLVAASIKGGMAKNMPASALNQAAVVQVI